MILLRRLDEWKVRERICSKGHFAEVPKLATEESIALG